MIRKLLDRISVDAINSFVRDNLRGLIVTATPIVAESVNGVFTVQHDLGVTPLDVIACPLANIVVYATAANRESWTATSVTLTGTGTGTVHIYLINRL